MGITIALAGNPNCGKTTLFNALTGANQYVGNWPGVTVEKKEGKYKGNKDVTITDLPGIYSLSPYTLEEVVARNYLIDENPDVILNIVDGTNLERNLYLTTQLVEVGLPVVVAVNMIDLVEKNGDKLFLDKMADVLGVPVVDISALHGTGIDKAVNKAIELAKAGKPAAVKHSYSGVVEHALAHIEELALHNLEENKQRWYAIKLFERDEKIQEKLKLTADQIAHIEKDIKAAEDELDDDAESIITGERYNYIGTIIDSVIKKATKGLTSSDKIDKILTNRILALPIFVVIMFLVYWIAVSSLGTIVTDWTNDTLFGEWIQPGVQSLLEGANASDWVISLVVDGIIGGIAAPIGFAPQMAIVFFLLSILEDCGYMARVAFIMDRIFRRFGLSGKSFIPFLISSGCGVPGIMGTRTIENEKDRRMTMMTTTWIPCGAKLPVIALIAGVLATGGDEGLWWVSPIMYFIGIVSVILGCIILKKTKMFAGDPAPFVMELPQYHLPSLKTILIHVWERVWSFLKKAGTVLFVCCAVMWFLGSWGFGPDGFGMVDTEYCLLASIGGVIAIIFKPLGFGTWQAVAASLSGFVAKEGIVSTMALLAGLQDVEEYSAEFHTQFASFFPTTTAAFSFLVFNLLDSPCLAALSAMGKEMGDKKWTAYAIIFQNIFAYCVTLMIYQFSALACGQVSFGVGTVAAIIVLVAFIYLLFRKPAKAEA